MRQLFTASDISAHFGSNTRYSVAMIKFIRSRMVPTDEMTSRESLFAFDTLEAYQLLRSLMLDDSVSTKQWNAYNKYMNVLKGWL